MPSYTKFPATVTQSNVLIEAQYRLSARQLKFILYTAARIQPDTQDFGIEHIKMNHFLNVINVNDKKWGNGYKEILKMVSELNNKPLNVFEGNNTGPTRIFWVSFIRPLSSLGIIEIGLSPLLKPYLLELRSNFTVFELENIWYLKSAFSIRLYMIFKSRIWRGKKHQISIPQIRKMLGIETVLKNYAHFKEKVIIRAQKDLKENTDIQFTIQDEVKSGKKVVAIIFQLKKNTPTRKTETDEILIETSQGALIDEMAKIGISKNSTQGMLKKGFTIIEDEQKRQQAQERFTTFAAYLNAQINKLQKAQSQGNITNPGGWLRAALKDYYVTDEELSKEKQLGQKHKNEQKKQQIKALEQELEHLKNAHHQEKEQAITHLLSEIPDLLSQTIQIIQNQFIIQRYYDQNKSPEENYQNISIRGCINAAVQEQYPSDFVQMDEIYKKSKNILEEKINKLTFESLSNFRES